MKKLSGAKIDEAIVKFAQAQKRESLVAKILKLRKGRVEALKLPLIELVKTLGSNYAEKSTRLSGDVHSATITIGTMTVVKDDKVDTFQAFLRKHHPELEEAFFKARTTYEMVDGPDEVLRGLALNSALRRTIDAKVKACFGIEQKAPSLKVELGKGGK